MTTHSDVSKSKIFDLATVSFDMPQFSTMKRHLSLNYSHLLFQVVTGATDGIGKQYAKSVSEISSLSGSLFIQFRCLTVINNNFSITRERRKKYGNAALRLDGRKTKL